MTQLVEEPIRYLANPLGIVVSAFATAAFAAAITIGEIGVLHELPIHFGEGSACYTVAHHTVCK